MDLVSRSQLNFHSTVVPVQLKVIFSMQDALVLWHQVFTPELAVSDKHFL
jgi:hypothetical protein